MKTLSAYIEYTLQTRHYCYVPGLGAFLMHEVGGACVVQSQDFRLSPPRREVSFSTRMRHDDGMLTAAIMETTGCTYDTATDYVRQQVADVQSQISDGMSYRIGSVGTLMADNEQNIIFQSMPVPAVDDCNYGFATLHLRPWQAIEADITAASAVAVVPQRHDDETILIPVRKQWLRNIAVIALVICAFFAAPSPFFTDGEMSETASMLETDVLSAPLHINTLTRQTWDEIWERDTTQTADPTVVDEPLASEAFEKDDAELSAIPATRNDITSAVAQSINGKVYCIIVASCASQADAESDVARLARKGYDNIRIMERDGRYRLCIDVFATKDDALTHLSTLREVDTFHDAWVLPVRTSSLNNIISNIDDNLSMELSHLNQRTERDQG